MTTICATPSLFFYLCASILVMIALWRERPSLRLWARRTFLAGFVLHSLYIPLTILTEGPPYLAGRGETMGLLAWVFALSYLVLARQKRWQHLASFFVPLILILHLQALLWHADFESALLLRPWWGLLSFHLAIAVAAVAVFFSSFLNGVVLLWQERRLKSRGPVRWALRLPTLPALERSLNHLLMTGFVALTLTLLTGMVVGEIGSRGEGYPGHRWWSLMAWSIYAVVLLRRRQGNVRNRSWVFLSLVGFGVIMWTFLEVHAS